MDLSKQTGMPHSKTNTELPHTARFGTTSNSELDCLDT